MNYFSFGIKNGSINLMSLVGLVVVTSLKVCPDYPDMCVNQSKTKEYGVNRQNWEYGKCLPKEVVVAEGSGYLGTFD